jgi:putative transposase
MRIVDPRTGRIYVEKRRCRYNEIGQARELTFSCYRHYAFLSRDRTREWFREALEAARANFGFQLWAYVLMPEHVRLLVYPGSSVARPERSKERDDHVNQQANPNVARPERSEGREEPARPSKTQGVPPDDARFSRFLQAVKEPVARKGIAYLKAHAPAWLPRLTVREGRRVRHRFWQPGGGYDRNITDPASLRSMIEYIHANPVRRGLVSKAEEWEWSSARWFAGLRPVKIEMANLVLSAVQCD